MIDVVVTVFDDQNRGSDEVLTLHTLVPVTPAGAKPKDLGIWSSASHRLGDGFVGLYYVHQVTFFRSEEEGWITGERSHDGPVGFFFEWREMELERETGRHPDPFLLLNDFDPVGMTDISGRGGNGKLHPATGRYAHFVHWKIGKAG
jgi:hypothetical protein